EIRVDGDSYRTQRALDVRNMMMPLQRASGGAVLAGQFAMMPDRLARALTNPRKLFFDIRPVDGPIGVRDDPELMPIVFMLDGCPHVGWQTRGALKYGFDYEPLTFETPTPAGQFHPFPEDDEMLARCARCQRKIYPNLKRAKLCWDCL